MRTKKEMYQTARWEKTDEYVKLNKYHKYGDYYDITTISGEKYSVFAAELTDYCL
jgi:hypothetical protein